MILIRNDLDSSTLSCPLAVPLDMDRNLRFEFFPWAKFMPAAFWCQGQINKALVGTDFSLCSRPAQGGPAFFACVRDLRP